MANFDDRSGFVPCPTSWGQWWQTMDEVFVEVNVPEGTRAKDIKCKITTSHLSVIVSGKALIEVCFLNDLLCAYFTPAPHIYLCVYLCM